MINKLKEILPKGRSNRDTKLIITKILNGYNLQYGEMYTAPPLNFTHLKQLSDLFGTLSINVNNYDEGGCETCDYGSNYGNDIHITDITLNEDILKDNINKNLYKE